VSNREFYIGRAAECLLASGQVGQPVDRAALLHMAASYITLATKVEHREAHHCEAHHEASAPAPKRRAPPISNRDAAGAP
jgi:hypothetical protein